MVKRLGLGYRFTFW